MEQLESRYLLAGDFNTSAAEPLASDLAPITWFESFSDVPRIELDSLDSVDRVYPDDFQGPRELAAGEWIVQLSDRASGRVHVLRTAARFLDEGANEFSIIAGLGSQGLMLVRGQGVTAADIEASLAGNEHIETFSLNSVITGQATTPDDPDFGAGLMEGLTTIGAESAWDVTTGSMQTVVGVVDSGIDLDHPDLYLNIWLNQGEIPSTFKDDLVDVDGDGLITFYDLNNLHVIDGAIYVASTVVIDGNGQVISGDLATSSELTNATPFASGVNAAYVRDLVGNRAEINGRIDALDLLSDPRWSDGRDNDHNGFFDDLVGVNFRGGEEHPFPPNEPDDVLGHGTHVAGTIGAVGNNLTGVTGVNWQTSLMSLRILDNNNRSDAGAGLRAVNYAKMMRERHAVDAGNRTIEGANVRVLNNSWGQPGGYEPSFEAAISELGEAGVLFVAAAGNGDIFGNGVDNDQTPFYPAGYDVDNVIAVAASTNDDRLATFSNYGRASVDIAAPGVGIRSTVRGGSTGAATGTSMATPHVSGAAALIWSDLPESTVGEVKRAILGTGSEPSPVTPIANGEALLLSKGRLNLNAAINANVFAPTATVVASEDITSSGGTTAEFTIEYRHRDGIDAASIGDDDLVVSRTWGESTAINATLKPGSVIATGVSLLASYEVNAPGGVWDPLDFGGYVISTVSGNVTTLPNPISASSSAIQRRDVGEFSVRIDDTANGSVHYVGTYDDIANENSLRDAVDAANSSTTDSATIILEAGTYSLQIPSTPDASSSFPFLASATACTNGTQVNGWSNNSTGDLVIEKHLTIVGDSAETTVIDGGTMSRLFKVHPNTTFNLKNIRLTRGSAPGDQGGGAILSAGNLHLDSVQVDGNRTRSLEGFTGAGGAISLWGGDATIVGSTIGNNEATNGAGLFLCNSANATVSQSAFVSNFATEDGGGISAANTGILSVDNTTFSQNSARNGAAIFVGSAAQPVQVEHVTAVFHSGATTLHGDIRPHNSLFAGNTPAIDFGAGVVSEGFNIASLVTGTADATDIIDAVDLAIPRLLGPLNSPGGAAPSHPLLAGNPAIAAANPTSLPTLDQNGVLRPETSLERPDIGAVERSSAEIVVNVFADLNRNGVQDTSEPGLSGFDVELRQSESVQLVTTGADDPSTFLDIELGKAAVTIDAGVVTAKVLADEGWIPTDRSIEDLERIPRNATGSEITFPLSVSFDGRYLLFSSQTSFDPRDSDGGRTDIYIFDRMNGEFELISDQAIEDSTCQAEWGAISPDGNWVVFDHFCIGSVFTSDIFLHDRRTGESTSIGISSIQNRFAGVPEMSGDGRFFVFSVEQPFTADDQDGNEDVYLYDRALDEYELLSNDGNGVLATSTNSNASISADGRYVVFRTGDLTTSQVMLLDRATSELQTIATGDQPSLSANGNFVAFQANDEIRLLNRVDGETRVVSSGDSEYPTTEPPSPFLSNVSGDGRFVSYESRQRYAPIGMMGTHAFVTDVDSGEKLRLNEVFLDQIVFSMPTRFPTMGATLSGNGQVAAYAQRSFIDSVEGNFAYRREFSFQNTGIETILLQQGDTSQVDFGVFPESGRIEGVVFEDALPNQIRDLREQGLADWRVFVDENENSIRDAGELSTLTDADGIYLFDDLQSYRDYNLVVEVPSGWEQVFPTQADDLTWSVFLEPGGELSGLNFGFRAVSGTGQSSDSTVMGRVFEDVDQNGRFDESIDRPRTELPVYFDSTGDREHSPGTDEPIVVTDADGRFELTNQPSRIVTLRAELDESLMLVNPLGNNFEVSSGPLFDGVVAFRNVSAAANADFNRDGFEDLAVLLSDGNQIAVRLNNGTGDFSASDTNLSLSPTSTLPGTTLPIEFVIGQFNNDTAGNLDVAVIDQAAGAVLILLDYDHSAKDFLARQSVSVGQNPISVASGDFDKNGTLDLAVLNYGTSTLVQTSPPVFVKSEEAFQLLINDGAGTFTAQTAISVPGDAPVSIVSDDFNNDGSLDLAVLHRSPTIPDSPFGDVTLFAGNGAGVFSESHREPVEGGPLEMVAGDFNGDGIADLAVANVAQNTMSILAGRADGAIIRETAHPIGTGEKGIDSMDVADIDNDGDLDIVATRLSDGGVAIFRNITDTSANPLVVQFEPLESFGVAQASIFERAPIVLANFDNDTSGPGGEGTIDVIAIPKSTATVNVLKNTLVDGGHRVALDGLNTISGLDFIITPTGDVDPPVVTDVKVAGADWTTAFKSAVDSEQLLGFSLPGTDQLRTLSWDNLDTLYVEFSEDVEKATGGNIDAADVTLGGINIADYETHADFGVTTSYSNGGGEGPFVLTIQLAGTEDFAVDRITLGLQSSVVDLSGNVLDGEWADGTSTVSGDGTAGGDFVFHFNVLPGDVDGSGGVLVNDVLTVNATQFTFPGVPTYQPLRDVDGSGSILASDVLLTNERQFTFLPPEPSEADEPAQLPAGLKTLDSTSVDEVFGSLALDVENGANA